MLGRKLNKKGFSLVELIISVAIFGVIATFLTPAITASFGHSREKADDAALKNLSTNIQMTMQHSSIYGDALQIANKHGSNQIVLVYTVNHEYILELDYCYVELSDDTLIKSNDGTNEGNVLKDLEERIEASLNGKLEPIKIQSKPYRGQNYKVVVGFQELDFTVNVAIESYTPTEN